MNDGGFSHDRPYTPTGEEGDQGAPPIREAIDDEPLPKLIPLRFVKGEVLPPRVWIVDDGWIPARKTTLIQGDGGDGKTSLAQQLQSSCATGLPWLGLRVNECVSVGFYTEDEAYDMKERQAAIDAAYGYDCIPGQETCTCFHESRRRRERAGRLRSDAKTGSH